MTATPTLGLSFADRRAAIEDDRRELDERETALLEDELAADEGAHADLVTRCRAAKDTFESLTRQIEAAQSSFAAADRDASNAHFHLAQHKSQAKPQATDYPTSAEVTAWQDGIRTREATLASAEASRDTAWRGLDALQSQRGTTRQAFTKLADEEKDRRGRVQALRQTIARRKPQGAPTYDATADSATYVIGASGAKRVS